MPEAEKTEKTFKTPKTDKIETQPELPEGTETFTELTSFVDLTINAALGEYKRLSVDVYNTQLGHLKQGIYLAITELTAIAAVMIGSPFGIQSVVNFSCVALVSYSLLGIGFLLALAAFFYGVFSLRGSGHYLVRDHFMKIVRRGFGADGSGKPMDARLHYLKQINKAVKAWESACAAKGEKIRALNGLVLGAAGCAAFAVLALFSTTLWSEYDKQRAAENSTYIESVANVERIEQISTKDTSAVQATNTTETKH